MKRLLYISTARSVPTATDLQAILDVSRRNNARVGVTGMLVSGGRRFLQALEGPTEAVDAVYRRIAKDPRHFAIVVLSQEEDAAPSFGTWDMGYRAGGANGGDGDLATVVAELVAPIADPTLRAYFTSFAQLHAAA